MDDPFGNSFLPDFILSKAGQREQEQLEHERKLAAIRAQSHALTWMGTAEELTDTIKTWYESGWLTAESFQDAIQRASIHFAKPDGTPVLKPANPEPSQTQPKKALSRREFVTPILDAKGWSIFDWANEANVSHATALDYLANKTKAYRSTRLKLAKALGISIEQLPR
jgi:hypothetical protein